MRRPRAERASTRGGRAADELRGLLGRRGRRCRLAGLNRLRQLRAATVAQFVLFAAAAAVAAATGDPVGTTGRYTLTALLALAMGVQNATARRLAVADVTTAVLTLTLTGIAADSRRFERQRERRLGKS